MAQQSTVNTLRPVYDLVELGLDDYEENELVLGTIHDLKLFFENPDNCTCCRTSKQKDLRTCFEKVGFKRFFKIHFELKALEEHKLELFIKSQLMSFEIIAYLKLCGIIDYLLFTLQSHLQINGLTEHVHRNTGHASKMESRVFLDFNITSTIKQFLIQYGIIHRLPSTLRHHDDSGVFIYLLTSQSYISVYNEYKKIFYLIHDQPEKIISYSTFKRLWHEIVPNLQFQPPASNLCKICTSFKAKLLVAKKDINKYNKVQV
ncbi:5410_t:CDS:2, partial [Cetraspora pellucida]